jgi:hypothetical protein
MHLSNYYAFVALDLARERTNEANAERLAALAHPGEPRTWGVRRAIARVALAVARAADAEVGRTPVTTH